MTGDSGTGGASITDRPSSVAGHRGAAGRDRRLRRIAGLRHLPALADVDGVEALALADTDASRMAELGRRHGPRRLYPSHVDLVADPDVDVVAVCVLAAAHAAVAIDALESGKHVLVEKPLCLSLDDAGRLVEASLRARGVALVGFNLRWHRLARGARRMVRDGAIGEVDAVRTLWTTDVHDRLASRSWRSSRDLGGGALLEVAAHDLDLLRFLLDDEVAELVASSRSGEWDDEAVVVSGSARPGSAVHVHGRAALLAPERARARSGRRARYGLSLYRYDGLELVGRGAYGDTPGARVRRAAGTLAALPGMIARSRRGGDYVESYRAEWRHLAAAARGAAGVECTVEDGRRNLELLLAASESCTSGLPVTLAAGAPAAAGDP